MNKKETLAKTSIQPSLFHDLVVDEVVRTKTENLVEEAFEIYQHDPEKALKLCTKSIQINANNKEAYYLRGILRDIFLCDYEKAIEGELVSTDN